jgi:hypothetical protein
MTYRQTYQLFLEQLMAAGGTPKHMATVVEEFNAIENPDYHPTTVFTDFVKGMEHHCSTCGRGFHTDEAQLDAETTCAECLSGSTTGT